MIFHRFAQGSPEWFAQRARTAITASEANKIVKYDARKKRVVPALDRRVGVTTQDAYLCRKMMEFIDGRPLGDDDDAGAWAARGKETEAEARAAYSMVRGVDVEVVGFLTSEDGAVGCSPDGLCPAHGLELKCPSRAKHAVYMRHPDALVTAYMHQVQASLWVCRGHYDAWELVSYCPRSPREVIVPIAPEPMWQDAMDVEFPKFVRRLNEAVAEERERLAELDPISGWI